MVSKKKPRMTTHWFYLKRAKVVVDEGKGAEQRRMAEVNQAYLQKQKKKAKKSWAKQLGSGAARTRTVDESAATRQTMSMWPFNKRDPVWQKTKPHQQSGPLNRADLCLFVHLCAGLLAAFYNHFICLVNWIIINGSVCESVVQVTGSAVMGDILTQLSSPKLCEEMSHLAS